jgi:hypothetical protein
MELQTHHDPRSAIAVSYPAGWAIHDGDSFQIVNERAPNGAITISVLGMFGDADAPPARLSYDARKVDDGPPGMSVDSWTFVGGGRMGIVTYCHGADAREEQEARVIIESIAIGGRAPQAPKRTFWQRLFAR